MGKVLPLVSRRCGPCQLCCVLPEIPELGKPEGVPCVNLTPRGCGIYNTRPQVCRDFVCNWLDGEGGPMDRPDTAGAYVTRLPEEPVPGIQLWVRPGYLERWQYNGWLKMLVRSVVAYGHTVLVRSDGAVRSVFTKDRKVLRAVRDGSDPLG